MLGSFAAKLRFKCFAAVQVEEGLEKEVKEVEYALENDLKSFGKGFTVIEKVCHLPGCPEGVS